MATQMKNIGEIPTEVPAKSIGLEHCSNGFVGWLEDGAGNKYRAPR